MKNIRTLFGLILMVIGGFMLLSMLLYVILPLLIIALGLYFFSKE